VRKHFKILVEYDPRCSLEDREEIDKKQMGRLLAENPGFKIVNMARQLFSDYRAFLYAELEPNKPDHNNN